MNFKRLGENIYGTPFVIYPHFIDYMGSPAGGILLSFLMSKFSESSTFTMSDNELYNHTSLNKGFLEAAKKSLKERMPMIKVTRKGLPAKTHYEIDWRSWFKLLGAKPGISSFPNLRELDPQPPVKPGSSQFTEIRETGADYSRVRRRSARSPSGIAPGGEATPTHKKEDHPRWAKYAKRLADAINQVRKLNRNSNIRNWAYSFLMIHKGDGVPIPRIKAVLDWYCQELKQNGDLIRSNPKFLCIAYTGQTFREKFFKLEGQMKKDMDAKGIEEGPTIKIKKTIR